MARATTSSTPLTVTFSEDAKGWVCFKSFIQDSGLSLNNDYYTLKDGELWKHHDNQLRNTFYGDHMFSHVDVLFNEESATVKSFASMKYEGTQAKITKNLGDKEYYNNEGYPGWYVESGITDLQLAGEMEFKDKEGKWFSYMKGVPVESVEDLNSKEFSYQGIDILNPQLDGCMDPTAINYCSSCITDDGSCVYCIYGCMDLKALNYDPNATCDDGSCIYSRWDCVDSNCTEDTNPLTAPTQPYATLVDCQRNCVSQISGCTDPIALNYNPLATVDDGSCLYCVYGCTNPNATNYDPLATCDDGSCTVVLMGCTDPTALNYYPAATTDDGSCMYPSPCMVHGSLTHTFLSTTPNYPALSQYPGAMISDFITSNPQYHNQYMSFQHYFEFEPTGYPHTNDYLNPLTNNYQRKYSSWNTNNGSLASTNPWHGYIEQTGTSASPTNTVFLIVFFTWIEVINWVNASGFVTVTASDTIAQINTAMQGVEGQGEDTVRFTTHSSSC